MTQFGDDVDEKWKVITIWIGGNDVCAIKDGDDVSWYIHQLVVLEISGWLTDKIRQLL